MLLQSSVVAEAFQKHQSKCWVACLRERHREHCPKATNSKAVGMRDTDGFALSPIRTVFLDGNRWVVETKPVLADASLIVPFSAAGGEALSPTEGRISPVRARSRVLEERH